MSRPISESLSLLSETLGNCKTNLKEKEVADVDNIKISDVDEKIAEIQSGGGGIDWDNPKYMTITPKQTFWTYDVLENKEFENEIKVKFDITEYEYNNATFYILVNGLDFEIVDENSEFQGNWNKTNYVAVYSNSLTKKIKFKGTGADPIFLIIMPGSGNITDIAKIDVYNT